MILIIPAHVVNFCAVYPMARPIIAAITMPAFLIITGYLVNVNKHARDFAIHIAGIFIPYAIMVTGFAVLSMYLPTADRIEELSVRAIAHKVFVTSIGPYWFLQTMIACSIIYYVCVRLLATRMGLTSVMLVFGVCLMTVAYSTQVLSPKIIPYYFFGAVLRQAGIDFTRFFRKSPLALLPLVVLLLHEDTRDYGSSAIPVVAFCTISFLGWMDGQVRRCVLYRHFLYVGANTLPIYLFHPIFTMLAKLYLPLFAFDRTGLLHAFITVVLATEGSLALAYAMDRTHLTRLFGRPAILR